jgi:hypothetical protein
MFLSSTASNLNVLLAKNSLKYAFTASVSPAETNISNIQTILLFTK